MEPTQFIAALKMSCEPTAFLVNSLLNAVKASDSDTRQTFFASENVNSDFGFAKPYLSELREFSARIIAFAISCVSNYGFDRCVVSVNNSEIDKWFNKNAQKIGKAFILNFAAQKLGGSLSLSQEDMNKLSETLSDSNFINLFFAERERASDTLSGKLILLTLGAMNSGVFNTVLKAWKQHEMFDRFYANYDTHPWLSVTHGQFLSGTETFNNLVTFASRAVQTVTYTTRNEREVVDGGMGRPAYGNVTRKYEIRGDKVFQWIKSVGQQYGLAANNSPNNECRAQEESGCVLAGAKILMADGALKNIESIKPGDLIFNVGGAAAVASKELVINREVTEFYAVNGDDAFMSPEHPILTQTGWKCLRPDIARQLNPDISVSDLNIGDVICKVKSAGADGIKYENVRVDSITTASLPDVTAFDLHFSEGYKSYHANGYCCMLNYPEITSQLIKSNLFGAQTPDEISQIGVRINELSPMLTSMFGQGAANYIKQMADNISVEYTPATNGIITAAFSERYFLLDEICFADGNDDIQSIRILQSTACVTYKNANETSTAFSDTLTLSKHDEIIYFAHGDTYFSLNMAHDGLFAHGQMLRDGEIRLFTAAVKSEYEIGYEDKNKTVHPLGRFTLGFEPSGGGYRTVGRFFHNAMPENNIAESCILRVKQVEDKKTGGVYEILTANIKVDNSMYSFLTDSGEFLFETMVFDFSLDYKKLAGTGTREEEEQGKMKDKNYPLNGSFTRILEIEQAETALSSYLLRKPPLAQTLYTTANFSSHPQVKRLAEANGLNVDDLFSLSMPEDISKVHEYSFNKIKNMMLYVIPDDWREVINVKKPTTGPYGDLTDDDVKLITENKDIKDFLTDNFGKGYLSMALSRSTEKVIQDKFKDIQNFEKKLDYYWKGIDNDKNFSKSPVYSKLTNDSYAASYAVFVPCVMDYKNNDAKGWAKKLYEYITSDPAIMIGLAAQTKEGSKSRLHHIMTILDVLDNVTKISIPTADGKKTEEASYSCALYYKIMTLCLADISGSFIAFDPERVKGLSETELKKIIENYFKLFLEALLRGEKFQDISLNEEIQKELQRELIKYMEEQGINTVEELLLCISDFTSEMATIIMTIKNLNLNVFNKFMKNYPGITKFLNFAAHMFYYAMALFSIIAVFSNLDKMDIKSWTLFALNIAGVVTMAFNNITSFKYLKILSDISSDMPHIAEAIQQIARTAKGIDVVLIGVKNSGGSTVNYLGRIARSTGLALENPALRDVARLARWAKIAKVAEVAALGLNLLILGACLAFSIWQTVVDFRNGESTELLVLETIEIVTLGVAFIVDAGIGIAAIMSATICSAIPIIGVALMIVGVIIAIVLFFLPRKPQETKAEKYVDQHSKAFINGLPIPTKEWQDKQNAVKAYLTGQPAYA